MGGTLFVKITGTLSIDNDIKEIKWVIGKEI